MGMFDYIRCDAPLPDGWKPKGSLQTKDFDCEMVEHIITSDGKLMLERIDEVIEVPKHERPYPDAPDDCLQSICGSVKYIKSHHAASDFHGVIRFYGYEGDPNADEIEWHEYNAKFTDGQLVEIRAVPNE